MSSRLRERFDFIDEDFEAPPFDLKVNCKAFFVWLVLMSFAILLVLRLDGHVACNWFLIFVPLWVFDCVVVGDMIFRMIRLCRNGQDMILTTTVENVFGLIFMMLMVTQQVLLCVRLEYTDWLPLYCITVPLWVQLIMVSIYLTLAMASGLM